MDEHVIDALKNEIESLQHWIDKYQLDIDRENGYINESLGRIERAREQQSDLIDRKLAIRSFLEGYEI